MRKLKTFMISIMMTLVCSSVAMANEGTISVCEKATSYVDPDTNNKSNFDLTAGQDGTLFAARDVKPIYLPKEHDLQNLKRFVDELKKHDADLVLALIPQSGIIYDDIIPASLREKYKFDQKKSTDMHRQILASMRGTGAFATDLVPDMRESSKNDFVFYKRDYHWNLNGSSAAADAVARTIKEMPVYKLFPKMDFNLTQLSTAEIMGTYGELLEKLCPEKPQPETHIHYNTHAESGKNDPLTSDSPMVALVGTSFSHAKDYYGFVGSLEKVLRTPIINNAITGGGANSSLIDYFTSGRFQEDKPRVVIWEMPITYGISSDTTFRQVIPAVKGACTGNDVLASHDAQIQGTTTLLEKGGEASVKKQSYLHLTISDLSLVDFTITLTYANGEKEDVNIKRSTRKANNGKFYLELSQDGLKKATLSSQSKAQGTVETTLCKG